MIRNSTDKMLAFVRLHELPLFETDKANPLIALFDSRGFWFSEAAEAAYIEIRTEPHLYVAHRRSESGWYVGKSYQGGGRWKRQHAYHLGTLAHDLLATLRDDDQNHSHWIDSWMVRHSANAREGKHSIHLVEPVFITFIPFAVYAGREHNDLDKSEIIALNALYEKSLINALFSRGIGLLNIRR
jgi:hypothetical protein